MRTSNPNIRILFVVLVAALLLFGTTLELTHVHPGGATHANCALCQSAHNIVRPSAAPCIRQVFVVFARVVVPFERRYREHIFSFSHWNRPPPDQTALA
ncbi:MAG: hypothetical protein WBQ94_00880 [Terracidiphilus sp.]